MIDTFIKAIYKHGGGKILLHKVERPDRIVYYGKPLPYHFGGQEFLVQSGESQTNEKQRYGLLFGFLGGDLNIDFDRVLGKVIIMQSGKGHYLGPDTEGIQSENLIGIGRNGEIEMVAFSLQVALDHRHDIFGVIDLALYSLFAEKRIGHSAKSVKGKVIKLPGNFGKLQRKPFLLQIFFHGKLDAEPIEFGLVKVF